ncbi:MAG TPA: hypothetical protein VEH47_05740 [Candidatus Acidoferrales bacterium]|nr:hypothetical protein [Candidatus Acidoferrales bacterium]
MKRTRIFTAFLAAALALMATSCGTSDYLESLQLTSSGGSSAGNFFNLAGVDGTVQLQVLAVYHSGKSVDVTNDSTFTMTPIGCVADNDPPDACDPYVAVPAPGPDVVTINKTGLMTGIAGICTWTDAIVTTGCTGTATSCPATPPIWEYTGYYQVTATYRNFTSQPVGVGMGVAASPGSPDGGCGPTGSTSN